MVLLSGIEQLGFAQLARASVPRWIDVCRESASRASDPGFHGANGHPESGRCLVVAELAPYDQQQRVTILPRQSPQLSDELYAQGTILVLDQLRRTRGETLQRLQASLLGSTMIGDDVIGDAEQPGQDACVLSAAALSPAEGAGEHLRGELIAHLRADSPSYIPADRDVMTLVQDRERRRVNQRLRKHLCVR
jgi:hypothetical protein